MSKMTQVPAWEFGEGCRFEPWNSRLIGVSGRVYENIVINEADFMAWLEEQSKKDDPK